MSTNSTEKVKDVSKSNSYKPQIVVRKVTVQELVDKLSKYRNFIAQEFNLNSSSQEVIDKFIDDKQKSSEAKVSIENNDSQYRGILVKALSSNNEISTTAQRQP